MGKKNITKNYIFNVLYHISLIIIPIIVTPYISRVLLPEGIGEYSFSYSLITYFTIFAALGFSYYAQREIAKDQDNKRQQSITFWEINICRLISVLISLSLNIVLVLSGVYGKYSILMALLCINILAVSLDISFYFQGNEEFGKLVLINLLIKVLGTASIFIFVKSQNDVWLYTLLNSLVTIVSNLSVWCFLPKRLDKVNKRELKPLRHLKGTVKLFIPNIAVSLYTVLDKTLIGVITNSNAENGFYEQADKIIGAVRTFIICMGSVMIPRNSYEIARGNFDKVNANNYKAINFVWLLGIPMTFGLMVTAYNFVPWFLGIDFYKSAILIIVLACLNLIIGISNVLGLQYLLPYKKDKQFIISITSGAITNLILNIPLIYFLGALGAAIATIVSECVVTISMMCLARKDLMPTKIFKLAIKPIIAGLIMLVTTIPLAIYLSADWVHTIIIIVVGIITYFASILLLKEPLLIELIVSIKQRFYHKNSQQIVNNVVDNKGSETSKKEIIVEQDLEVNNNENNGDNPKKNETE